MDLKLFGKNAIVYATGNVCLRAAAFLLLPVYTYNLTVKEFGALSTMLMTIQLLIVLINLGTRNGYIRFAKEWEEIGKTGTLICSSLSINVVSSIVFFPIVYLLMVPLYSSLIPVEIVPQCIVLTYVAAVFQSLSLHLLSVFRFRNEACKFALIGLFTAVFLAGTTYVYFLLGFGIQSALWGQVLTYGLLWTMIFSTLLAKEGAGVSWGLAKELLRYSLPLVIVMAGGLIAESSAFYLLTYFGRIEEISYYSIGMKISQIVSIAIVLPFQLAYEPFVYANLEKSDIKQIIPKLLKYFLICFSLGGFFIAVFSKNLLSVLAPADYFASYIVIFLVLPGLAFKGVYYVGESLLHIKKNTRVTGIIVLIFTVLTVGMNFVLIDKYGMYGAIISFTFNAIGSAVVTVYLGIKGYFVKFDYLRLLIILTIFILLIAIAFFSRDMSQTNYFIFNFLSFMVAVYTTFSLGLFDDKEREFLKKVVCRVKAKA